MGIIVGVVLIIAVILLLIFIPKKSKKQLYVDAIRKSIGLVSNEETGIESTVKNIQEKIEKSNYKLTINSKGTQDEAGYSRSESIIYFGKDKLYFTESASSNTLSYALEGMIKDDKFYFEVKDVLDNVYYISKIGEMLKENEDSELYSKLADYIIDSFVESLDDKAVTIEDNEVTINGKAYKSKMHSYAYTGETLYNLVINLINKIKDDKDIYKDINKLINESGMISGMSNAEFTRDQINALLDQLVVPAKELKNLGSLGMYNIYLYDNEVICAEVIINGEGHPTIAYYNVVDGGKAYTKLSVVSYGFDAFTYEQKETSKGNSEITISSNNKEVIKGYVKEENGNYELKLQGAGDNADSYILLKVNSDYSGSLKIVGDVNNIDVTFKLEKTDKIPEMDVKGSIPYEEMPASDKKKLEDFIGMIFPSTNTQSLIEGLDM